MVKSSEKIFVSLLSLISFNIINCSLKFNIPSHREKCFQQEFYIEGTLLIRYDLQGYQNYFKGEEENMLFDSIHIYVRDAKGKIVYDTSLKSRKDKFAIFLKEPQAYLICTKYFKKRKAKEIPGDVLMGIKIRNDYQYTSIDNSVNKQEVSEFWKKIRIIRKDIANSIEGAEKELVEEDNMAKSMINSINTYYKLCAIQMGVIIVLFLSTIFSFKDFFKSKSII